MLNITKLHLIAVPHDQVEEFTNSLPTSPVPVCMSVNADNCHQIFAVDAATLVTMRLED